jgi:hypothetical protein
MTIGFIPLLRGGGTDSVVTGVCLNTRKHTPAPLKRGTRCTQTQPQIY